MKGKRGRERRGKQVPVHSPGTETFVKIWYINVRSDATFLNIAHMSDWVLYICSSAMYVVPCTSTWYIVLYIKLAKAPFLVNFGSSVDYVSGYGSSLHALVHCISFFKKNTPGRGI